MVFSTCFRTQTKNKTEWGIVTAFTSSKIHRNPVNMLYRLLAIFFLHVQYNQGTAQNRPISAQSPFVTVLREQ